MRKIIGKKPRYPTWLERSRTLSQIIAEEHEKEIAEIKKKPRKKSKTPGG